MQVSRPCPPGRGSGFVLVTVLAMLVILSLLAGTVALITQRLRDEQFERQRLLQAQIDIASTRASVLYLLTSQRMTFGGLTVDDTMVLSEDEQAEQRAGNEPISFMPTGTEIAMDSSVYEGLGSIRFAVQDDRGLLAVNWTSPALLAGLVETDDSMSMPTLVSLLLDYQDPDDLYRLNSAEREGYLRAGLAEPSNRTLATPLELRRVMGWDQALASLDDAQLNDAITVTRSAQINVNTAPLRVLQVLPGVDATMAERVVAARGLQPFIHLSDFFGLLGAIPVNRDSLSLYPSPSGTLKLWSPKGGAVQLLHWTLTPLDDGGRPWREDYEFTLPQDGKLASSTAKATAASVLAEPPPAPQ